MHSRQLEICAPTSTRFFVRPNSLMKGRERSRVDRLRDFSDNKPQQVSTRISLCIVTSRAGRPTASPDFPRGFPMASSSAADRQPGTSVTNLFGNPWGKMNGAKKQRAGRGPTSAATPLLAEDRGDGYQRMEENHRDEEEEEVIRQPDFGAQEPVTMLGIAALMQQQLAPPYPPPTPDQPALASCRGRRRGFGKPLLRCAVADLHRNVPVPKARPAAEDLAHGAADDCRR